MRIRKTVKAGCNCNCKRKNPKEKAIHHIKHAMECLALVENDSVCSESIANLSVVLLDLCDDACDAVEIQDDSLRTQNADNMGTFTDEGQVDNVSDTEGKDAVFAE